MPENRRRCLRSLSESAGDLTGRSLIDPEASIPIAELVSGSVLNNRTEELYGRSVLVVTTNYAVTAAVLMELDGMASRLVLCPADFQKEHLSYVIRSAAVDAVVFEEPLTAADSMENLLLIPCSRKIAPATLRNADPIETEWILLTSGTTGPPKLVAHTLATLTGAITPGGQAAKARVWSTLFDIRRFGGLQVFLRAVLGGSTLVLTSRSEQTSQFLSRMASLGTTHISATPTHWRNLLMSPMADQLVPLHIRLAGEIADDGILSRLRSRFPGAEIVHSFASTETGVAFEVRDCRAGFPVAVLDETPGVDMKIADRTLRVRSNRTAIGYLGEGVSPLKDAEGFIDTGDLVEVREQRCIFTGRRGGIINVGGAKISPEEVEAVINLHPEVHMCVVKAKRNPVTGSIVVADIVLRNREPGGQPDAESIRKDILHSCSQMLPRHKVPVVLSFVPALPTAPSGKILRISD